MHSLWFDPLPDGKTNIICDDLLVADLVNFAFSDAFVALRATGTQSSPFHLEDGLGFSFEVPVGTDDAERMCHNFLGSLSDGQLEQVTPPSAFAAIRMPTLKASFSTDSQTCR